METETMDMVELIALMHLMTMQGSELLKSGHPQLAEEWFACLSRCKAAILKNPEHTKWIIVDGADGTPTVAPC